MAVQNSKPETSDYVTDKPTPRITRTHPQDKETATRPFHEIRHASMILEGDGYRLGLYVSDYGVPNPLCLCITRKRPAGDYDSVDYLPTDFYMRTDDLCRLILSHFPLNPPIDRDKER